MSRFYTLCSRPGPCPCPGFTPSLSNRDITAEWLDRVCHDVVVEPPLQPLTGENVIPATANRKDDARADIHARGFWGRRQSAFFDVRVFHPNAQSYRNSSISAVYRRQEMMKKGSMVTEFGR